MVCRTQSVTCCLFFYRVCGVFYRTQHAKPGQPPPQSQANTLVRPSMGQSGPTAAGLNENTMAHVERQQQQRPYMGERTPQPEQHRFAAAGSQQRLPVSAAAERTLTSLANDQAVCFDVMFCMSAL